MSENVFGEKIKSKLDFWGLYLNAQVRKKKIIISYNYGSSSIEKLITCKNL